MRSCRATRGRCPLWTTPDLLSKTPYRSPSLGLLMDDGPSEPTHTNEQSLICFHTPNHDKYVTAITKTALKSEPSVSCLRSLWFSFDNRLLRLLCLGWGCFSRRGLDVGVLCLVRGTCLCLALVQDLFLDLQLQPCTLFPLLLLPLMSALHRSRIVPLRVALKIRKNI